MPETWQTLSIWLHVDIAFITAHLLHWVGEFNEVIHVRHLNLCPAQCRHSIRLGALIITKLVSCTAYKSPQLITGVYNNSSVLSRSSRGQKSDIKVSSGLTPSEPLPKNPLASYGCQQSLEFLGLWVYKSILCLCSHMAFLSVPQHHISL